MDRHCLPWCYIFYVTMKIRVPCRQRQQRQRERNETFGADPDFSGSSKRQQQVQHAPTTSTVIHIIPPTEIKELARTNWLSPTERDRWTMCQLWHHWSVVTTARGPCDNVPCQMMCRILFASRDDRRKPDIRILVMPWTRSSRKDRTSQTQERRDITILK